MPRSRHTRIVALSALVALLLAAATACGDAGELQGAGPTETAVSPDKLWPRLTPASRPAYEIGEVNREVVKGVMLPGDDIRDVNPVAVVRKEMDKSPGDYEGENAQYRETGRLMAQCGGGAGHGKCPVLRPYYRDLTGDGQPELTLGFRLMPGKTTAVRVYTVEKHRLMQVMSWDDAISSVELAGRSVIIRSPSEVAGYEYRLQWTWDADQKAMLLTHDEMLRTGHRKKSPHPSPSPSGSPSLTPSASTP
ncbi:MULTISPECIES: hypothetical protein [Streptomyces]|uniref:hypothetical protein n=1 Tax=Streptomyces TaxID=1883 RepID=UPI0004C99B89|nr:MULTISPECIES: hypothetical protein [unclassified Streptomyces]SEC36570.1 hypothetical protein SAMN05428938_1881 [Streptomyces sp. KS_5]SED17533.1 hypothetical protein SAMN05216482_6297 [Streptomyces sp. PAN_FS17]